jgi:hypothetical protein
VGGTRRGSRRGGAADGTVPRPERSGRRAIRKPPPARGDGEPRRSSPGRRQATRVGLVSRV